MSVKLSLRSVAFAAAALPLVACDALPPIDVPFDGEFTFAACPVGAVECPELPAAPPIPGVSDFSLADSPEFKDAGGALDKIEKVELTELTLSISEGEANFDWLNTISFQAATTDDSLPPIDIATLSLGADDKGGTTITLTPTGADIAEYIKGGAMLISAKPAGRLPGAESNIKVAGIFAVTFGL